MNSPTPEKRKYPGTNLYMTLDEKDLMEQCAIQISAQTGKQITPSSFARYILNHFHTQAMITMLSEHRANRR